MKLLLDECVPRKFKFSLTRYGQLCLTVSEAGFAGKKNGELLALAEKQFDVLITVDRKLRYQQRVEKLQIGVLIIRASSNRLADIQIFLAECITALQSIKPGQIVEVGQAA